MRVRCAGGRLLRLLEVGEDRPRRPERAAPAREAQPLDGRDAKVGAQAILGLAEAEACGVAGGHRHPGRPEPCHEGIVRRDPRRQQDLRRPAQEEGLGQPLDVGRLAHPEVGGRHVGEGDAQVVRRAPQRPRGSC